MNTTDQNLNAYRAYNRKRLVGACGYLLDHIAVVEPDAKPLERTMIRIVKPYISALANTFKEAR